MDWKEKYSFNLVKKITNATSKLTIEKDLINRFKKKLEAKGLPIKNTYKPEWDTKNKKVLIRIGVGRCKNLAFIDNKAYCLIYEKRPKACRDYFCKKARNKILLEKS